MKETMETLKCKAVHVAAGAAQTARLVALISKKKFASGRAGQDPPLLHAAW